MAIGSSIPVSVPTVGSTVSTLAKARAGVFQIPVEMGDIDVPMTLELRASQTKGLKRSLGCILRFDPSVLDVPTAVTKGRITVSLTVDATLGSEMTETDVLTHVQYLLSAALDSDVIPNLVSGSLE